MAEPESAPELLSRLSERVADAMGLSFPPERRQDLERGVRAAAPELGFADPEECLRSLASATQLSPRQIEILAGHLTIGETYFWRDGKTFAVLEEHVLPPLIRTRRAAGERHLRLWSAGCCTGEEPYSLAILLRRLLPEAARWNITILATDINPRFLHRAEQGVYGEWSFRDTPPWLREQYFQPLEAGRWAISPEIRRMVTFAPLNLAEDVYPALVNNTNAMDLIFCRNVLMYLDPERSKKTVEGFHHALVEGGWLSISPTEATHLSRSPFVAAPFPGAILYRKGSRGEGEKRSAVPAPSSPPFSPSPAPPLPPSPAPPPPPARDAYAEARALFEQGRYAEAAEALGPDPPDARDRALLARICANAGRLPEALAWCDAALAADKLSPAAHYLHATILQEMGDREEAVRALRRALFLDHDFVPAHFAMGNLTRQQNKLRESERHFANALLLLRRYRPEEVLPESEGMTAGRLAEIIASVMEE